MSVPMLLLLAAVAAGAAQAPNTASQQAALRKGRPPIRVEVVSVDVRAGTVTVRELDTIPAKSDKPIDVVLAVVATAAGQPLSRTKPGQRVAITCEPAAPAPAASAPVSLGDCVRVIEIDARPKPR